MTRLKLMVNQMKNISKRLLVTDFIRAFAAGIIVYIGLSVSSMLRERFMPNLGSSSSLIKFLLPLIIIYFVVYLVNNVLKIFSLKGYYLKSEEITFLKIIGIIVGLFFWPMVIALLHIVT